MELQSNLDQADRNLPHPDDSDWAPACLNGPGQTDPDMLVRGHFLRENHRSTRTDVMKLSRNGEELLADPPADVGFIRGSRMTGRRAAVVRLDGRRISPARVLLIGSHPAQDAEKTIHCGHGAHQCRTVELYRPSDHASIDHRTCLEASLA